MLHGCWLELRSFTRKSSKSSYPLLWRKPGSEARNMEMLSGGRGSSGALNASGAPGGHFLIDLLALKKPIWRRNFMPKPTDESRIQRCDTWPAPLCRLPHWPRPPHAFVFSCTLSVFLWARLQSADNGSGGQLDTEKGVTYLGHCDIVIKI